MIPPTPITTLFPYTTLFRSSKTYKRRRLNSTTTKPRSSLPQISRFRRDRKSTRLNSSHLGISYAVFCLKKKKQGYSTIDHLEYELMKHHYSYISNVALRSLY